MPKEERPSYREGRTEIYVRNTTVRVHRDRGFSRSLARYYARRWGGGGIMPYRIVLHSYRYKEEDGYETLDVGTSIEELTDEELAEIADLIFEL